MRNDFKEEAEESEYRYVFYDFDANTGFHLYDRLNKKDKDYLTKIAKYVSNKFKSGG